ncbi:MAG: hypothetical protein IKX10_02000 [Lachnospiraceae bacterium]|nr:hypothetical protein [Lachnospiraceae bacterium]
MKPLVGILDHEKDYGERLAAFIAKQPSVPFDVVLFSSAEKLREYMRSKTPDLLLLGLGSEDVPDDIGAAPTMYLTEEKPAGAAADDSIWRYSGAQEILRQLSLRIRPAGAHPGEGERLQIFTVYSPATRCRKTEFSIALAGRMSDRARTLFITFEEYGYIPSGTELTSEAMTDLSDVIFYIGQGAFAGKLPRFLQMVEGLEFIAPVRCPQDIRTLDGAEAVALIRTLAAEGKYDCIVVDAGYALGDVRPLLAASDRIFVPSRHDVISTARVEAFRSFLVASGCTQEAEKLEVMYLPDGGEPTEQPYVGLSERQAFFLHVFEGELMEHADRVLHEGRTACAVS